MAGSLLVFKNEAFIAWRKKKRRKERERKTLREREFRGVGEHTVVNRLFVIIYLLL